MNSNVMCIAKSPVDFVLSVTHEIIDTCCF